MRVHQRKMLLHEHGRPLIDVLWIQVGHAASGEKHAGPHADRLEDQFLHASDEKCSRDTLDDVAEQGDGIPGH